jgi:hypothetical protein
MELRYIQEHFSANVERVRNLVALYEMLIAPPTFSASEPSADLLRAAVVLLHATLEDLLRSVASLRLPAASAEALARIPLVETDRERFSLVELARFRGRTVDSVISDSVEAHLQRSSYNHPGDIVTLLRGIGVEVAMTTETRNLLGGLMHLRHLIAHRADREFLATTRTLLPISPSTVGEWVDAVERFAQVLLTQLDLDTEGVR